MASDLRKLLEEIRSLPTEDQERLRKELEAQRRQPADSEAASGEETFKQRLLQAGLLTRIKTAVSDPSVYGDREPCEIQGAPLSATILEERR